MAARLRDPSTGKTYPLDPAKRFLIGRSQGCDLRLTDGTVARTHADIEARPGEHGVAWYVRDRGSTNGTSLNGKRLGSEAEPLRAGDVIRVAERPPFVFEQDDALGGDEREPPRAVTAPRETPAARLRAVAAELIAGSAPAEGDYRAAPAWARAAPGGGVGSAAAAAIDRVDDGDLVGAFEALLTHLDERRPASPRFIEAARALITLSPEHAAELLERRVIAALHAGVDATGYAALLAESGDDRALFRLRSEAGRMRDGGDPRGRALLTVLAETEPSPWRGWHREHLYQAAGGEGEVAARSLAERVAWVVQHKQQPEPALVAEVVAALRAAGDEDSEKRAALVRMLDDLTWPDWMGR